MRRRLIATILPLTGTFFFDRIRSYPNVQSNSTDNHKHAWIHFITIICICQEDMRQWVNQSTKSSGISKRIMSLYGSRDSF